MFVVLLRKIRQEVEQGCRAFGIGKPWQGESVFDRGKQRIMIAWGRPPYAHRMLGDSDERDATTPPPISTARSVASRIVPSDKKNRSICESRGINDCGYRRCKKRVSRRERDGVGPTAH